MSEPSLSSLIKKATKNIDNPQSRQFLRELGLGSLFLFNRIFIESAIEPNPEKRLALPKKLFFPVLNFIQDDSLYRKGLLMPRYFFKSTTVTEAKPIWDYLHDHNERILIVNETFDNASDMLGHIKEHIENNTLLRYCYPELCVSDTWKRTHRFSSKAIEMPRSGSYKEATFTCLGVGGAAQSRHYTKIYLDDLIGKKARESVIVRKDTEKWFGDVEQLLVQPDTNLPNASHVYIIATHWAPHDLYHKIQLQDKRYQWKVIPGEQTDGTPTWEERLSAEKIKEYKSSPRSAYIFYTQIQNNPNITDATDFQDSWLRRYELVEQDGEPAVRYEYTIKVKQGKEETLEKKVRTIPIMALNIDGIVDPAFSPEAKESCLTAIVVVGTDIKTNKRIMLEAWGQRISQPSDLYNQVFKFHKKYRCRRWGVEAFGPQQWVAKTIREEAGRRGFMYFPLRELKSQTGKDAKDLRIVSLQDEFSRGDIYIRDDFAAFMREYQSYPMGETKDILDALAWHKVAFNWSRRNKEEFYSNAEERYQKYLNSTRNEFL